MANVNMGVTKRFKDPSNVEVFDACMLHSDSNGCREKLIWNDLLDNEIDILEASLENTRSQLARLVDALANKNLFSNDELKTIIKGI
jgi:5-bromo-4-chloroindolyl phosphate hydrolysis protein